MSALGMVALGLQTIGAVLVLNGLLRRDPIRLQALRAKWRALKTGLKRLLRRRAHVVVHMSSAAAVAVTGEAILSRRPGTPNPTASPSARMQWMENAISLAFDELEAERDVRGSADQKLVSQLGEIAARQSADVAELRRDLDVAGAPERREWWGAFLLAVGLLTAMVDGLWPLLA